MCYFVTDSKILQNFANLLITEQSSFNVCVDRMEVTLFVSLRCKQFKTYVTVTGESVHNYLLFFKTNFFRNIVRIFVAKLKTIYKLDSSIKFTFLNISI